MNNTLVARAIRVALISSCFTAGVAQAQTPADDETISEVVVTGTYIRSENFQPSSPVDVVTREQLETRAPTSIAQFLTDLPYNVNSATVPSGRGPTTTSGGGTINLRNLGDGANLIMLNSRRHTKVPREANVVDVNSIVPQIMIRNIEILKDGASALYGSDAVSGVVNFITRDDFTGFEANAQQNWITYTGKSELRAGALWGANIDDKTKVVVGFEYNTRQQAWPEDMPLADGRTNLTQPWNPARYLLPQRNAAGVITARPTAVTSPFNRLDSGCGQIVQSVLIGTTCYYDFAPDNSALSGEDRYQTFARFSHAFSPLVKFTGEAGFSDVQLFASQSASASVNTSTPITIPGDNPGNVFRAVNGANQPLFAAPDPLDPRLPLRVPDANVTLNPFGRVVLMSDPTSASSAPTAQAIALGVSPTATGIAFDEDVTFSGRILGSQGGLATSNTTPAGEFARGRPAEARSRVMRLGGGFDGKFGESSWHWDSFASFSRVSESNNAQRNNVLVKELRLAMQGFGGPNCNPATTLRGTGQCFYFNPFTSAIYGTTTPNRQEVIDWLMPEIWDQYETSLMTYDAVASGDLFALPAGNVSLAVGGQYRKDGWRVDFDAEKNVGNIETGAISDDVDKSQSARAAFAEVAVPVVSNESFGTLNLNGAVRYENSGGGVDTTDPKLGALYKTPAGVLTLRASWGTSFLAPTLFQKFTSSSGLVFINDNGVGGTGETQRRITSLTRGNPNLEPQEATSYSFGFNVKPIPNLSFDVGYWHYKFDKLIASESVQAIATANDPTKVIRDSSNSVVFVLPSFVNVASLETAGVDFEITYRHDLGRFGALSNSLSATWVNQMDVQASPTAPVVNAGNSRAVTLTGAPANLKWRGLGRTTWSLGNQSATAVVHYNGRYNNDSITAPPGQTLDPIGDATLDAFLWVDLAYTYSFEELFGVQKLGVTVGAQNILNSKPDLLVGSGAAAFVDNRLRVAYLRLSAKF